MSNSDDIRLVQTLLDPGPADPAMVEMSNQHLIGVYKRAQAGEATAIRELMDLLTCATHLGASALMLARRLPPEQALAQAADFHATQEQES